MGRQAYPEFRMITSRAILQIHNWWWPYNKQWTLHMHVDISATSSNGPYMRTTNS
jgi:hypothetical protein